MAEKKRRKSNIPFIRDHEQASITFRTKLRKLADSYVHALSYYHVQLKPCFEGSDPGLLKEYTAGVMRGVSICVMSEFYASLTKKERFLHGQIIIKLDTAKAISVASYIFAAMKFYEEFGYDFGRTDFPFLLSYCDKRMSVSEFVEDFGFDVRLIESDDVDVIIQVLPDWPMFWPYIPIDG